MDTDHCDLLPHHFFFSFSHVLDHSIRFHLLRFIEVREKSILTLYTGLFIQSLCYVDIISSRNSSVTRSSSDRDRVQTPASPSRAFHRLLYLKSPQQAMFAYSPKSNLSTHRPSTDPQTKGGKKKKKFIICAVRDRNGAAPGKPGCTN